MERVLKLMVATVLSAALLAPAAARAGGVVTDGHGGGAAGTAGFDLPFPGDAPYYALHRPDRIALADTSSKPPAPHGRLQPVSDGGLTELEQIQEGLITEEEASSGCGGSTAARGELGLLPLLVAGLSLVLSRRR